MHKLKILQQIFQKYYLKSYSYANQAVYIYRIPAFRRSIEIPYSKELYTGSFCNKIDAIMHNINADTDKAKFFEIKRFLNLIRNGVTA